MMLGDAVYCYCCFLEVRLHEQVCHLYLSLLSRVFNGLEDVPCISAPHLRAGHILTVPSLNQDSRSYG